MRKEDKIQYVKIGLGIIGVILLFLVLVKPVNKLPGKIEISQPKLGGEIPMIVVATNASSTATSTSATLLMAAADYAQYRAITNRGPNEVFLSFKSTSTGFVAFTGYSLLSSTTLEMSEAKGNLWRGNIWMRTGNGISYISTIQL